METESFEIALPDRNAFASKVGEAEVKMALAPSTPGNAGICAKVVASNNKLLKEMKAERQRAVEPLLGKIAGIMKPIDDVIAGFSEEAKAYADAVLTAKKERHRAKCEEWYGEQAALMLSADPDKALPAFEDVYEPNWYSKTDADCRKLITVKLTSAVREAKEGLHSFSVFTDVDADEVEKMLIDNKINYERNDL